MKKGMKAYQKANVTWDVSRLVINMQSILRICSMYDSDKVQVDTCSPFFSNAFVTFVIHHVFDGV